MRRRTPLLALIAAAAVLAAGCRDDGVTPSPEGDFADLGADNVSLDVRFHLTHHGIRRALVTADTAYFYQGEARTDLRRVEATFFNEQGAESGRLVSRDGHYDMGAEVFTAIGDAVLEIERDGQERRIESEQLHYAIGEERMWSDLETRMEEDGRVLYGSSFESDIHFRNPRVRELRSEEAGPHTAPDRPDPERARPSHERPL